MFASVFRITKQKEELTMFLNEKEITKNMTVNECGNSHILIAKRELIVPEKKIILLDDMTEEENKFVKKLEYRGGIIV